MTTVKETHELWCPNCGSDDDLIVTFLGTCRLTGDGSEDCGDHSWDEESHIVCVACSHEGVVRDFRVEEEAKAPAKRIPICPNCKSHSLIKDAAARWSPETQDWEISSVYDDVTCDCCGQETSMPDWIEADERLFNCCTDNMPPDWTLFASLTVGGCITERDGPNEFITWGQSDEDAEFWTVYGRDKEGMAEAITDCKTRADADAVAAELAALSGLEVKP